MTEPLRHFDIDPEKWLCGTGQGKLLDENNKRCCLGFMAQQIGYEDYELYETPVSSKIQDALVDINDEKNTLSMSERVEQLNRACETNHARFRFRLTPSPPATQHPTDEGDRL